jgi:uncharacterized protein YjaZ
VLLGLPLSTPARVRADLPALVDDLRRKLGSRSAEDYERFFLGSAENQTPPSRAGYTVGYLMVKEVAGKRSLPDLARLRGPALLSEIDRALLHLAQPSRAD